ncbi:helix-turn-helix domain-containing protein [Nocardia blacklockiae]|uniref:helix-turn-helix domain-containing protein n=1 Tax=Nocardia blacklockiae TaxID=480036 RepID=UPI00189399B5|nr:helix-turn-helix transcriptional regulator [Nocardia blacklockiae]MBF6173137.1 helix-turn-helix domain-containing protein [Nocardia blacklockiae]
MISEESSSTLPRRQLGRFLREAREAKGMSLDQAARLAEVSKSGLHRIETAQVVKVKIREVKALCEVYEVPDADTERVIELAKQAQVKSWHTAFGGLYGDATFNMYLGLEAAARQLISYNEIIPGLLQTADYARALIGSFYRDDSPEDLDRRIRLRMKRQAIVTRKFEPVKLDVLLHESALHRVIGSHAVMAKQCRHLAEIGKQPNISIRIHPYSAGCQWGLLPGPFTILDFGADARGGMIEPPLVYFEGHGKPDLYLEDADSVRRYHELASAIRSASLDEVKSRDLLRRVAREYEA